MSGPMGLQMPVPGDTTNVWGTALNVAAGLIEAHDHTNGKGVLIPSAALGINGDVSWASYALTAAKAIAFTEVAASSMVSYVDALYVNSADHNLYFLNSNGVSVQITEGNTINLSLSGGIGGDYAAVNALLSYDDATHRYLFQQEGTPRPWAGAAMGNLDIYEQAASIGTFVRLSSPHALAANYTMVLPAALPAAGGGMSIDSSGQLGFKGGSLYRGSQVFTAGGTYTPTTGTTRAIVEAVGGGGGGGGVSTGATQCGAGGGGSGTYARWAFGDGTSLITGGVVIIGAGGAAGANTGGNGGDGGDTTIGINGTEFSTSGGSGGAGVSTSTGIGAGGAASGGADLAFLINSDAQPGSYGQGLFNTSHFNSIGGAGGSNPLGHGGPTQFTFGSAAPYSLAGVNGSGYGGGGSGACITTGHSGTAEAGGAGSGGIVIVHEYM